MVIVGSFSVLDKLPIYVDCGFDLLRKRKVFRELNALQESRFPNYDDAGGAHKQARKPPTVFKYCHVTGLKRGMMRQVGEGLENTKAPQDRRLEKHEGAWPGDPHLH